MRNVLISILGALLLSSAANAQTGPGANNSVPAGAEKFLLPVPQRVSLSNARHQLDNDWRLETSGNIPAGDPAVVSLTSALKERFGVRLRTSGGTGDARIQLTLNSGAVAIGQATDTNHGALEQQAYRLGLGPGRISITANAAPGLFYGVQTLVQLLQSENEKTYFPGG